MYISPMEIELELKSIIEEWYEISMSIFDKISWMEGLRETRIRILQVTDKILAIKIALHRFYGDTTLYTFLCTQEELYRFMETSRDFLATYLLIVNREKVSWHITSLLQLMCSSPKVCLFDERESTRLLARLFIEGD